MALGIRMAKLFPHFETVALVGMCIFQRQRLAPIVFLKGFSCHATDHIPLFGEALLPSIFDGQ
jgi:hypothetical protein